MYTLTFFLADVNDNILLSTNSLQDIANIFGDQNILNQRNEADLAMYLLGHYFHHVINGVKFYFANQSISNTHMTFKITYKQI